MRQRAMDAVYLLSPLAERHAPLGHFTPPKLAVTVVKAAVLQGAKILAKPEQPPHIPTHDAAALAAWIADLLAWPVAKDLAIVSADETRRPTRRFRFNRGRFTTRGSARTLGVPCAAMRACVILPVGSPVRERPLRC
jgi:hypothetical protein